MAGSHIATTKQTDVMDANGPFVRRLEEKTIADFGQQHTAQKLVGLYLGHDGIDQAFLTIVIYNGASKKISHASINLPADPKSALRGISVALPDLLRRAGIPTLPAAPDKTTDFLCKKTIWDFVDLALTASDEQQACQALALGSLLPSHKKSSHLSPAKQAWLARAYTVANNSLLTSESGKAIRDMAWFQLGLGKENISPLTYVKSTDPVISRLAQIVTLSERIANSPVRSTQDARTKEIKLITKGVPTFAAKLMTELMQFDEPFSQVDYCGIELASSSGQNSSRCIKGAGQTANPLKLQTQTEHLFFQDWQIAASYKELEYYAFTLGIPEKAHEAILNMPANIIEHPFVRRVQYWYEHAIKPSGGHDEYLQRTREVIRNFVQSTVNFQSYDNWYTGYSLADHAWTSNFNIMNDPQITPLTSAELRLVVVMKFDRFSIDPEYDEGHRSKGEPAYFLASSINDVRMGRMMAMAPQRPKGMNTQSSTQAVPSDARPKPMRFTKHMDIYDKPSIAAMQADLFRQPNNLDLRTDLAIAKLKEGAALSEAIHLIDERLPSQRIDDRVAESHAWATPAYAFYYAGEIDAAKKYYTKVRNIGTGSAADMLARVRLPLIAKNIPEAVNASKSRMSRYDNEFAWFDTASFMFVNNTPEQAWSVFLERAPTAEYFPYWIAALTGHRMQNTNLNSVKEWLSLNKLNESQINGEDVAILYLHMLAVMDRLPSDIDIAILSEPRGAYKYKDEIWSASAKLIRSALENSGQKETYTYTVSKLSAYPEARRSFLLPIFTWIAWQATEGKDEDLEQVRQATTSWDFDNILAKSLLLALEGKTDESLRFFKAARYEQSALGLGNTKMLQRPIPASYQYALSGYLMYKKTGVTAYRDETLHFVQAYQSVFPQFAWLYSMEALLEPNDKNKKSAACRAKFLDPQSYFLKLTGFKDDKLLNCPKRRW